ncbi:MAG: sulfotransferase [Planctomycetes bacterium]|nr:sulfotransferase [Planctomycetota bacterium]
MGWREAVNQATGPGINLGITTGEWLKLLAANGFRIPPRFWPRTAFTTAISLVNTAWWATIESFKYSTTARQEVPAPIFILGHWRSGTTHLHNLMSIDERFAYPRFDQVMIPSTFVTGQWVLWAFSSLLLPRDRMGVDVVKMSPDVPWEEEFALNILTQMSPYAAWSFPHRVEHYERYITFRGVPQHEIDEWKAAFVWFLKKLTLKLQRPLIMKSPPHTGRIKLILEMFPDAKFVHIHRNPFTVYQSTKHLQLKSWEYCALQTPDEASVHGQVIRQYRLMMDAFFEERSLIPAGRFYEVSFAELEKDPLCLLERVYQNLSLPDFSVVKPKIESYCQSLSNYKKNKHIDMPAAVRDEVSTAWRRSFEEWNYPLTPG